MEPRKVKLKSNDNKIFEVPVDILAKSNLLSGILPEFNEEEVISLREVDGKLFEKILDYLNHYKDFEPKEIPKPFPERTDDEFFKGILNDEWTFDFLLQFSLDESIQLINAADYLQIDGLINILAARLVHEMCNCEDAFNIVAFSVLSLSVFSSPKRPICKFCGSKPSSLLRAV